MAQHMRKNADIQVMTANRTIDGEVVYLTPTGGWSPSLDDAKILDTKEKKAAAEKKGAADLERVVLTPYLFEVVRSAEGFYLPVSVRERIRMSGPTVRLDLGKQGIKGIWGGRDVSL